MVLQNNIAGIIEEIAKLPVNWHGVGSLSPRALMSIAQHAERIGPIRNSVETGSGKSTLLFSHLSTHHVVFALNDGESISRVKASKIFNNEVVTFVEGPTQQTLPYYQFDEKLQIALIDGPHGYPFPDIEYYYFYPLIESGGLLLIDDIKIPSIKRMFEIICADDMFNLVEILDNNLAILKRTDAPLIDPYGDSWWLQGYNKEYFDRLQSFLQRRPPGVAGTVARLVPQPLKNWVPAGARRMLRKMIARGR